MIKKTEQAAIKELDRLRRQLAIKRCPLLGGKPCLDNCVSYEDGRYNKRGENEYTVYGPSCSNMIITGMVYVER